MCQNMQSVTNKALVDIGEEEESWILDYFTHLELLQSINHLICRLVQLVKYFGIPPQKKHLETGLAAKVYYAL